MVQAAQHLGRGTYSVAEAARLVRMNANTARAWFGARGRPLLTSDYPRHAGDFAVSFLDLMEAHAVRKLREVSVAMPVIRRSRERLVLDLDTTHPFAHRGLYTDGKNILADFNKVEDDGNLREALSGQGFFRELQSLLHRVDYHDDSQLIARWTAYDDVLIDPEIALGKPAVEGTATHTHIIHRQYYANGEKAGLVADLFDITEAQVNHAVEFEESLKEPPAR